MITPAHLRAARALLGLTIDDIAATSGLSAARVEQAESGRETDGEMLRLLRSALEEKGISFLADNDSSDGGIGVRMRHPSRHAHDSIRPEHLNAANDD